MIRRVGDTAASITPTMLGIDRHVKSGHMAKFWNPVVQTRGGEAEDARHLFGVEQIRSLVPVNPHTA